MPVVSGLVSARDWIAEAMGVAPAELLARFLQAADLDRLQWDLAVPARSSLRGRNYLPAALILEVHKEERTYRGYHGWSSKVLSHEQYQSEEEARVKALQKIDLEHRGLLMMCKSCLVVLTPRVVGVVDYPPYPWLEHCIREAMPNEWLLVDLVS